MCLIALMGGNYLNRLQEAHRKTEQAVDAKKRLKEQLNDALELMEHESER